MAQSYVYDGGSLTRVRHSTVALTQTAEGGKVGEGSFTYNDTPGTQEIVGQKDFLARQTDCAFDQLFDGFVQDRNYERAMERVGPGREIEVTVEDLNAMLAFRNITDGKRPAETVDQRMAWIMGSAYVSGLFVDNGRVASSDKGMDEADYTDQKAGDVIGACALRAGFNHYIRDFGAGPELVFRDDNTSTADTSDIVISNVIADVTGDLTGNTVYPFRDFRLTRRPGNVYSRIRFRYANGVVTRDRPQTATAFNGERDGTASQSDIKSAGVANEEADRLLWVHHTEEDFLEGSVLLTPEQVNLLMHGDRVGVHLQHLTPEGYYDPDELAYCRVLERTVRPKLKPTRLYEVHLRLGPQEAGPPTTAILQSAFGQVGDSGGLLTLPNPVTVGSTLVFCITDRDGTYPVAPNTSASNYRWGAGAWTKFPDTRISDGVGGAGSGVAIWWKTADSTEQTAYIPASNAQLGIFEISGADMASATYVYQRDQTAANPMTVGSLGTAATGTVAITVGEWYDQGNRSLLTGVPDDPAPQWSGTINGWITDSVGPAYWSDPILYNAPFTWIAHAFGDGSALTASGTRGPLTRLTGQWSGVAILIPPL